ncbi:MAG: hypothetical protein RIC95_05555 [Vicingaceae bacterium]
MSSFAELVENLDTRVRSVVQQKQNLRQEVQSLNDEIQLLQKQKVELQAQIKELEEKNKILRIAGGSSKEDQREMKLKINEIVREVDKCIAQLNQ